jgi:hypothetical protein
MQSAHKVRLKLIPDLMFILVFASTDDAVPRAVGNHIDAAKVGERGGDHFFDGFSRTYVAEETEAVVVPVLHAGKRVLEDAADGYDEVTMVETGADQRVAHVSCAAEDLGGGVSEVSLYCIAQSLSQAGDLRWGRKHTIHTSCFAGFPGTGGSQLRGSCSFEGGLSRLSGDGMATSPFCSCDCSNAG